MMKKLQYFIISTSKVANQNLIPFFKKWGLDISSETGNKLDYLPMLENAVWELRDIPTKIPSFKYTFKDSKKRDFATMLVDITADNLTINTLTDDKLDSKVFGIYTSIQLHDQNGKVRYEKIYVGNKKFQGINTTQAISQGDYITVYQKDYLNRLEIINLDTEESLKTSQTVSYKVTDSGIELVDTKTIPSYKKPKNSR